MIIDIIIGIAIVLISAILYRTPRGGGLKEGMSFEGSLIWAVATCIMWAIFYSSWIPLLGWPLLMLAEAPGWSHLWPNQANGGNKNKLNWRGSILLNPIMGEIYFKMYELQNENKLPLFKRFLKGWTEWAEILSGLVTSTSFGLILLLIFILL